MMNLKVAALCGLILALGMSCTSRKEEVAPSGVPEPEISNRIAIPPEVVTNIGITFEKARRGNLNQWLRVSGHLDVPEDQRWVVRSPADGRVEIVVRVGDRVEKGTILGVLESPALLAGQQSILSAINTVANASELASAAASRLKEAEQLSENAAQFEIEINRRRDRLREIHSATSGSDSAISNKELIEAERSSVEAGKRSLEAAVLRDDLLKRSRGLEIEVQRARIDLDQQLVAMSVLTGIAPEALGSSRDGAPVWKTLKEVQLPSPGGGIVMSVAAADGEHVSEGMPLLAVSDPSQLTFHGFLPESDLDRLTLGAPVRVVAAGTNGSVETTLWDSPPTFDESSRNLLISAWVPNPSLRIPHGISATGQILIGESKSEEVLLLEDCVIFDGLEAVVYVRDSSDPGFVTRTSVELGMRSAGFVEILAGLLHGDDVVLDGVHQLKETGLGKAPGGGHFHADGSYHEGD